MGAIYLKLQKTGELAKRIAAAQASLESCDLCPRKCQVNRLADERGFCRTGADMQVASYAPHFGEEAPLVGLSGSGTIFISNCNLGCVFCQNYDISHLGEGVEVSADQLAAMMISLQKQGCHNINFVSPTHVVPQILAALPPAIDGGLHIPLVYNSGGYDAVDTLALLDGVIDIYMPDFKFWHSATSKKLAKAADYPDVARQAICEMHRQVGDLQLDKHGIASKGLLARHLVMPGQLDQTEKVLAFLADISPDTYVNVMDQYRPLGECDSYPEINRELENDEYKRALEIAKMVGLTNLDNKDFGLVLRRLGLL